MSVTINSTPVNGSPAYSPNIYSVSSTNSDQQNFQYVAQIYSGTTLLGELRSVPSPNGNWGKFDVSNVVSGYVEEVVSFDDTDVQFSAAEGVVDIRVDFGESYTSGSSPVRVTGSVSDSREYFNGSPYYEEFVDIHTSASNGQHPYLVSLLDTYPQYPLTSRRTIETARNTKQWLYYYSDIWQAVAQLQIRNDVTNNTAFITLNPSLQNNVDGKVVAFRVDAPILEGEVGLGTLTDYSVRTRDTNGNASSEWISFKTMDCTYWDLYSLYYLNRFGGIDSFSMQGKANKSIQSRRGSYKTLPETINTSGVVSFDTSKQTNRDHYVNYSNRYRLTSGWVSEEHQNSAIDLQTSPLVWLERPDGVIIPVRIQSNTLEIKNRNDGVISVSLTVTHDEKTNRQRV